MATPTVPLTAADYQQLHTMQLSEDADQRDQAAGLAKKLTADEQQAFFDFQKTAHAGAGERTRADNSLLGLPPELAVVSGLGVGRAVAGAAVGAASRAAAGAKAVATQAAPLVKYELTKTALEKIGVPSPLAVAAAMMVSGYKKGAKAGPIAAGEVAAPTAIAPPVEPIAAGPVGPTAAPAPIAAAAPSPVVAAPAAAALPDQRSLNEAALAVRRAAYQARLKAAPVVEAPPARPSPATVPLSAAEQQTFVDLLKRLPAPDAMKSVLAQRDLAARLGTPSAAQVAADVAHRKVAGKWN